MEAEYRLVDGGGAAMPPSPVVVKTYTGTQDGANKQFKEDALRLAALGYTPTSQSWAPGSYGCGMFLLALLLCIILVGLLIFIYMLLVKPDGTLTVTYQFQGRPAKPAEALGPPEKVCPKCAERVKAAAIVCRFCGHNFIEPRP